LLEVEGSNPASIIDNTGTGSGNFPQLVFRHQGANRGFVYWDEVNDNLLIRSDGGASDGDVTFNTGATNDAMFIRQDGNVGVGTTSPNAKLEVSSVIKSTPTDSPGTCNSDLEGGMYYDASLNEPCFCDGSNWRQFDGGGNC